MSGGDSFVEFREAVYATLRDDPALAALLGDNNRVHSDVPQDAVFPYVYIEIDSEPFDTKDTSGREYFFRVHVFDEADTPKKAEQIASRIYSILHHPTGFVIDGFNLVNMWQDSRTRSFKDPEGKIREVDLPFRAVVM